MKNLLIGLLVIGLANLGYSQNTNSEAKEVKLEDITVYTLNISYLNQVQDETMSVHVKSLEHRASRCDIKNSPKFDGRSESFKVVFNSIKGSIIATYDNNGKILTTKERFRDIKLPEPVRTYVFKKYPKWSLLGNTYLVSYQSDKDAKKIYKVQIGKDNLKKNLKIDFRSNVLGISSNQQLKNEAVVSYVQVKN